MCGLTRFSITYADDLAILCRRGKAEAALQSLREIMGKLKLTVNEAVSFEVVVEFPAALRQPPGLTCGAFTSPYLSIDAAPARTPSSPEPASGACSPSAP